MSDEVTIKQVLLAEMDSLAHDLSNGDAGNIEKQGKALAYIMRILRPLVEQETVKEGECRERMGVLGKRLETHVETCPAARMFERPIESGGVILANMAKTSFPWLLLVGLLLAWKFFG
jgi:hypothetical protein